MNSGRFPHIQFHCIVSLPEAETRSLPIYFRMREVEHVRHTVRSDGMRLLRNHIHDWVVVVLLGILEIILYLIEPFHRFVGKDDINHLQYPLKDVTIPVWVVGVYGVLFPILIITVIYFRRRDVYDLHHGLLGLGFTMLIAGVVTEALKNASGRPRPDFFWRCFPDGKAVYDQTGNVICHGKANEIKDGYKSFPSGHSSWSFAGLTYLMLYLSGKCRVFDHRGQVSKLFVVILPPVVASLVAISLVDDYFHHWTDVLTGGIIGMAVAILCYLHFYPPPHTVNCWAPYAYFRALEESSSILPNRVDGHNIQVTGAQRMQQQREGTSNLDTIEFGR